VKNSEFEKMSKEYLLPSLPGFTVKGDMLFENPLGMILHGICYERSGFDKNIFRVEVIAQPLYIPSDFISYGIGQDLNYIKTRKQLQKWWTVEDGISTIMKEIREMFLGVGITWLNKYATPYDIATKVNKEFTPDDPHIMRRIAYSWILCGEKRKAKETLLSLSKGLSSDRWHAPWEYEMANEVEMISRLLESDIELAQQKMMEFRKFSIDGLKLQQWDTVTGK